MSRYGSSKSYGRKAAECRSNQLFDQLLTENTNKPSTAKVSVAGGQRWGMTSFTSIRKTHINGQKESATLQVEEATNKRMKVGAHGDSEDDPFSFDADVTLVKSTKPTSVPSPKTSASETVPKTAPSSKPNKFFKSGSTRPLTVQNAIKRSNVCNSKAVSEKSNANTVSLKQLTLDQHVVNVTPKDGSYDYAKAVVNLGVKVQPSFLPVLDDKPQIISPPMMTNKIGGADPFDLLLLNSSPPPQKSDLQSFSVERLLGDSKYSSNVNISSQNPGNDSYFSSQPRQSDIYSLPSSQSYSSGNVSSQASDNDMFGSQSNVQSQISTSYGMDTCIGDINYPSYQTKTTNMYESDNYSSNVQTSPGYNKWPTWNSSQEPFSESQAPAPIQPEIFNPAFRTYARSKEKASDNALTPSSSSTVDVPIAQSREVFTNFYSTAGYGAASNCVEDKLESASTSGSLHNVIPDRPINSSSHYEPPALNNGCEPVVSVPIIGDSQNTFLSDSFPTDCSQESKESSQPDLPSEFSSQAENSEKQSKSQKSLFKSKKIFNSPKKMKAVYKYRPWHHDDEDVKDERKEESKTLADEFDDEFSDSDNDETAGPGKLTLSKYVKKTTDHGEVITSWKCQRNVKELFTVVHNVKQAHQCHESGETQEFNDDVEYLLEGIQASSSLGTRCLSTLSWATKCMGPSFRIHLRAHGTIFRVFSALMDAPSEPSLSLSTATLMFVLSQDRLTMDLEASTLSLLLQLLECNISEAVQSSTVVSQSINPQQAEKIREKVRSLCEEMQQKGYAKQLDLNNITGGILAMETLLSLSSRRTGEWFKEAIRTLGGLDYIVDTVHSCMEQFTEMLNESVIAEELDQLRKLDRCLRVIENVTCMNQDNQAYVLTFKNADLVNCCINLLQICRTSIIQYPIDHTGDSRSLKSSNAPGAVLYTTIKTVLKVLINVTHENSLGSAIVGSQEGIMGCVLLLFLQTPSCLPTEERFDLLVLSFALLINFVEFCPENRDRLVIVKVVGCFDLPSDGEEMSCIESLIEVFVNRLDLAKLSEDQASALLDGQAEENNKSNSQRAEGTISASSSQQSQVEQLEETLMKALQKAGKNMEHTIIAAYISLLFGCIIQNSDYREMVRDQMPEESFTPMIEVLRKFLNFVNLTGVVSNAGVKSIQKVLQVLESS